MSCNDIRGNRPSRKWFGSAFEAQEHLLEMLAWHTPPVIDSELPAYTQFAHCFLAHHHIPFMQLLSGVLPHAQRGPKRTRGESAKDGIDCGEYRSWKVRLRPRLFGSRSSCQDQSFTDSHVCNGCFFEYGYCSATRCDGDVGRTPFTLTETIPTQSARIQH